MSHHHDVLPPASTLATATEPSVCLLDTDSGEVNEEGRILTNHSAFQQRLSGSKPMGIAIETGTHSPWGSAGCSRSADTRS